MQMELKIVKDAFDHVTKKQKLCSSHCNDTIEQIGLEIEQALVKLQASDAAAWHPDHKSVLAELRTKLKDIAPLGQLEGTQKELNVAMSKYMKQLDKSFNSDISKAYRNVDFDIHTVNQIIAGHLYRQGLFDVGDCFINESGKEEAAAAVKSPFVEMYRILEALKSWNLEPALKWASANSEDLKRNGTDLELKLHQQQYVKILQKLGSREEALKYAKAFLTPFASTHTAVFQKLMACLLWAGKLDSSPYSDLLSPANWEELGEEVVRQMCSLLGQSFESPLSVTVAAGARGLPTLVKMMSVMSGKKQEWQSMKQLLVPVDLDREFQFHTIFVCPVSRDQATEENPPMLMSCGHVLCKQSILKLSKSGTKSFKCPYCPTGVDAGLCKQLYF
ncbi:hypothetical protein Nepgr_026491 [Nepenthes gracilis]|uniref:Uncharacterized protein n=1 Tax=Nepenthes gracilis TaxID=150966 RepID=A0AAD3T737_NEPGR|nr:hypothetical protein Nepgr_026491 [Nepenthes gracilis]